MNQWKVLLEILPPGLHTAICLAPPHNFHTSAEDQRHKHGDTQQDRQQSTADEHTGNP